ncbi:hypothetical protein PR048_004341 [Dryococelus australis]|uniref:Uncharacterized protein n=1 Tax=Dryococelus australis TaxID=614101 RepID=A0ABQ9I743_9NEOP|nr:hypothetical protein PR048_004341 [Dryococelus australis]
MKSWGKREIPEKTHRPTATSGTIPTCENPEYLLIPAFRCAATSPRWRPWPCKCVGVSPDIASSALSITRRMSDFRSLALACPFPLPGRPHTACRMSDFRSLALACPFPLPGRPHTAVGATKSSRSDEVIEILRALSCALQRRQLLLQALLVKELLATTVLTKDSVTVSVDAVVYYKVSEPLRAVVQVNDYCIGDSVSQPLEWTSRPPVKASAGQGNPQLHMVPTVGLLVTYGSADVGNPGWPHFNFKGVSISLASDRSWAVATAVLVPVWVSEHGFCLCKLYLAWHMVLRLGAWVMKWFCGQRQLRHSLQLIDVHTERPLARTGDLWEPQSPTWLGQSDMRAPRIADSRGLSVRNHSVRLNTLTIISLLCGSLLRCKSALQEFLCLEACIVCFKLLGSSVKLQEHLQLYKMYIYEIKKSGHGDLLSQLTKRWNSGATQLSSRGGAMELENVVAPSEPPEKQLLGKSSEEEQIEEHDKYPHLLYGYICNELKRSIKGQSASGPDRIKAMHVLKFDDPPAINFGSMASFSRRVERVKYMETVEVKLDASSKVKTNTYHLVQQCKTKHDTRIAHDQVVWIEADRLEKKGFVVKREPWYWTAAKSGTVIGYGVVFVPDEGQVLGIIDVVSAVKHEFKLVNRFSRGSPISPAPSFQCHSIFTSINLIDSQDLAGKSRPNLLRPSLVSSQITAKEIAWKSHLGRKTLLSSTLVWHSFIATSCFDPSMSGLPIIVEQNLQSIRWFTHHTNREHELDVDRRYLKVAKIYTVSRSREHYHSTARLFFVICKFLASVQSAYTRHRRSWQKNLAHKFQALFKTAAILPRFFTPLVTRRKSLILIIYAMESTILHSDKSPCKTLLSNVRRVCRIGVLHFMSP